MTEARPFASLSSGLLARKGAAKPAMRPQAFGQLAPNLDDLGWNDMGDHDPEAAPEHVPSSVAALTPAPRAAAEAAPVREQQRAIADRFGDEPEPDAPPVAERAAVVEMPRRRAPLAARDKAAFTLRLDPERHFRLRLACAVTGRSAQQIVTEALDDILKTFPEIDALAGQLPAKARARS
ncbi:MAG: hypothetical protein QOI38_1605 [Sphingomonadales bacterium]|jgi:hypothetical protein|nr:hypothetical protein [Sphingomonadales bacterium]